MTQIHIREALKTGWDNFNRRPMYLIGIALALIFFSIATSSQGPLVSALTYIAYGGYLGMLLKHYNGEHVVFDDFFSIDSRWISFAFLGVIKSALILVGLLCFIVPGIYFAMRFMFAELLVIEKGMRPIEALRASSEMTKGKGWALILFMLISCLLVLAGFFVFIIGAVVSGVVVSFATIRLYRDLQVYHG